MLSALWTTEDEKDDSVEGELNRIQKKYIKFKKKHNR